MIIGIDLGTTNSLVSYWNGSESKIIPNSLGENLTPSVVGVDDDGSILVGSVAKERLVTHPFSTVALFKRYMGSQREYELANGHKYSPEELSSFVLRALKDDAEFFLQQKITEAVISVPAYFNDSQRKATQLAGKLAGLKVERLINEPTAAALAHGLHQKDQESTYLVFDLGGGTFDVSVLSTFDGIMEVNATAGHNSLGGEDFTDIMLSNFFDKFALSSIDTYDESRLRWQIESMKLALSTQDNANFSININGNNYDWSLTKNEFIELVKPLINKIRQPIERVLNDAQFSTSDLDEIVLVGGASRMPIIHTLITRMFGRFPVNDKNPDELIALGAAVQAGLKARDITLEDVVLTDVCPYTLGLETVRSKNKNFTYGHFSPIINRNTTIPVSREEVFTTLHDQQNNILISVFQGESRLVKDNIKLGEMNICIPPGLAGEEAVSVRYTYDINGILDVDVKVLSNGVTKNMIIKDEKHVLSEDEIQQREHFLSELKMHPREHMKNRAIIARGERLYEQLLGDDRNEVGTLLSRFEQVLENQEQKEIVDTFNILKVRFDEIDDYRLKL